MISIRGEDLTQLAGSMELSQSNLPSWGDIVNLGTASTAKDVGDRDSTVLKAGEGDVKEVVWVLNLWQVVAASGNQTQIACSYC